MFIEAFSTLAHVNSAQKYPPIGKATIAYESVCQIDSPDTNTAMNCKR